MKLSWVVAMLGFAWLMPQPVRALSGEEVLKKLDAAEYGAKDSEALVKMVLIESNGNKSERKLQLFQKGTDKRLIRFLEPADVNGIAFLDEGEGKMYVYLPAFHKVRRVAGHVMNENFAGTDFSYEDLKSEEFSKRMDVINVVENDDHYVLECKAKAGRESQYSSSKVSVRKKDFLLNRVEFYDEGKKLWKVLSRQDFRQVGTYTQSFLWEIKDEKKAHSTQMVVESYKADTGLKDGFFSQRELKK